MLILRKICSRGPNSFCGPLASTKDVVANREHRGLVRDQDNDGAPRFDASDRLKQSRFALIVEVGVRFVEDDQEWIAIQGASQRNALPLSSR